MPTCQGKLKNGNPCRKTVREGKTYCRWHVPKDSWREIYGRLGEASPEEKTDIVLRLIEEHPEHRLILPERDGLKADLSGIDLSQETLPPRWRADLGGANLQGAILWYANLQSADLLNANLQGADLLYANLQVATFWGANLQSANLFHADLQGANLRNANLQGARLGEADLQGADLGGADLQGSILTDAKLQGTDLSFVKDMSNVYIGYAWLDRSRMRRELLGGAIGEERDRIYTVAKLGYLSLKKNFDDLGDYDAASWAYRKERRMEKLEARKKGRTALSERKWGEAAASYIKFASDTLVEWLCDYGESVWRVIGWMAVLLLVVGPILFSVLGGFVWRNDLLVGYFAKPSAWHRFWFNYRLYLLYTLDTFSTASFSGLQPRSDAVKLASGFFSIAGVFLAGLLGFVAGNRIRRS